MLYYGTGKTGFAVLDLRADERDQYTGKPMHRNALLWKNMTKFQLENSLTCFLYEAGETVSSEQTRARGEAFKVLCKQLGIKACCVFGTQALAAISRTHGKSTKLLGSTIQGESIPYIIPLDSPRNGLRQLRAYAWQVAMGSYIRRGLSLAAGSEPLFRFPSIITGEGRDAELALERILDEKLPTGNDVETSGKDFRTDRLTAMALANKNVAVSVPWDVYTSRMYGPQPGLQSPRIRSLVESILREPSITKLFHNGMFDLSVLASKGIRVAGPTDDTLLAHKICYPDLFHNLQFCVANEFAIDPWKTRFEQLRTARGEPVDDWEDTDPGPLFTYNAQDAAAEPPLWARLSTILDSTHRGWENYERLKRLAGIAAKIQFHGLPIDVVAADRTRHTAEVRIAELEKRWESYNLSVPVAEISLNKAVGNTLRKQNIKHLAVTMSGEGSVPLLNHLFFKQFKAPVLGRSKTTGEAAMGSYVLLDWAGMWEEHPKLAEAAFTLYEYRKIKKSYDAFLVPLTQERVYAKPQVAGTRGTRWSYAEPNLQQWSKEKTILHPKTRHPISLAGNLRNLILPDSGMVMGEHDYNALEARLVAYAAGVDEWIEWLANDVDMHLKHVKQMFGRDVKKSDPLRQIVKTLTYARFYNYGKGVGQVLKSLKPSMPSLTESFLIEVFDLFDKARPEIVNWQNKVFREVSKDGYVELPISGVRQYHDRERPDINAALSVGIQSTGGDIINNALLRLESRLDWDAGERILINVHDALVWQAPPGRVEHVFALVKEEMERPIPELWGFKNVIIPTDGKVGSNWKELMKLEKWKEQHGKV